LASTNRADILDKALLRPGRFDRQVTVDLPDLNGRIAILNLYLKKIKHVKSIDASRVASGMPGFSGADIENMVNESALLAARKGKAKVDQKDLEESRDKIIMGPERKTLAMTEEEKKITAYHEAGHAVVAFHCTHSDPIYKATIIPRGNALGMVIRLPENDRVSISKTRLLDDLAVALGGRVAEEIIFGADNVTTGASSDFQFATSIAKRMVTEWGMSTVTGMVSYPQNNDPFSSNDVYSEKTLLDIDQETKKIIDASLARTRELLNKHRDHLTTVANALIEKETLSGQDIQELLDPEPKTDKPD
jgi:cell division protease FtsH